MSSIIDQNQFTTNVTPIDPQVNERMGLAIMLLSREVPVTEIDDLESFAEQIHALQEALLDLQNDVALVLRARGTSQWDRKSILMRTCPLLAAIYRAEAIADERIEADQTEASKRTAIHDLLVQAVEERLGGPFVNPIYSNYADDVKSSARAWKEIGEKVGRE